jgi:hydroxyacylglutathione hydrolase
MAALLYDSLHKKLLTLADEVQVYPAHGAGSLCGRNLSSETSSTLGQQRRFNYALQPMTKDEFVAMMTADLPEVPGYFSRDAELNRGGAAALAELRPPEPLTATQVDRLVQQGAQVVDVRPAAEFGAGHVPGALNIGLGGQFASWAGSLLSPKLPLVLVAEDPEAIDEAFTRLARVGLEDVKGFLDGGMLAWDRAGLTVEQTPQMPVDELWARIEDGIDLQIVDVRRAAEYAQGHVPGAENLPLAQLGQRLFGLDSQRATAVVCASGFRSSAATSLLAAAGFGEVYNVLGGTSAWRASGLPMDQAPAEPLVTA